MNTANIFCFFVFCHFLSGNTALKCYECSDIQSSTVRCKNDELLNEFGDMPEMGLGKCDGDKITEVDCESSCQIKHFKGCKNETLEWRRCTPVYKFQDECVKIQFVPNSTV
eukprot:14161.XXX_374660_374276_1 [CDS] Oithona nana genome sequencing.